ncbi:MAG: OmpH family outer membrane protein [bacterium]
MKKRMSAGLIIAGLMAGLAGAADLKIAVVDTARILKEYYKTELAEAHIQQQIDDFTAERDKLMAQHKKLKQEFEALRAETQNKALTEEAREKKKELAEEKLTAVIEFENTIRDKAASRKKELDGEGRKIQGELAKSIKAAIATCSQKGGYSMVLADGGLLGNGLESVLYVDPKMDITDEALKILNADKPAAKELSP